MMMIMKRICLFALNFTSFVISSSVDASTVGVRQMDEAEVKTMMEKHYGGGGQGGLRGRNLEHGGPHNGMCCNFSGTSEYVLLGTEHGCMWVPFPSGSCIGGPGTEYDCEGATCGGGFYKAHGVLGSLVCTFLPDDPIASTLRWTPRGCGRFATSPDSICRNPILSLPSGYPWGPHPSTTCAPTAAPAAPTGKPTSSLELDIQVVPKGTSPFSDDTSLDEVSPAPTAAPTVKPTTGKLVLDIQVVPKVTSPPDDTSWEYGAVLPGGAGAAAADTEPASAPDTAPGGI